MTTCSYHKCIKTTLLTLVIIMTIGLAACNHDKQITSKELQEIAIINNEKQAKELAYNHLMEKYSQSGIDDSNLCIEDLTENNGSMLSSANHDYTGYAYLAEKPENKFMVTVAKNGDVYDNYAICYFQDEFSKSVGQLLDDWNYECTITFGQDTKDWTNMTFQEFSKIEDVSLYVELQEANPTAEKIHDACLSLKNNFGDINVSIKTENNYITYNLGKHIPTLEQIENRLN